MTYTRSNLIGFRAGDKVLIYCVACKEEQNIPGIIYRNKKQLKDLTKEFVEVHFGQCVMKPIEDAEKARIEASKPLRPNTIEIQTQRVGKNDFCFYQTTSLIKDNVITHRFEDHVRTYKEEANDRLRAAIANLGLACRSFADANIHDGCIVLENDKDGKDIKDGGEHNILFGLLFPQSFGDNKKNASIYSDYQQWLAKAKMLINEYRITIKLSEGK